MLLDRLYSYLANPPVISSLLDWLIAISILILPWIVLLWLLALLILKFWNRRAMFGTEVAVKLAYAWAALVIAILLVADVVLLLFLTRIPNWTGVTPQLTFALLSLAVLFHSRRQVKTELRAAQVPLRVAQQGGRS
jgi:hypothetical protein